MQMQIRTAVHKAFLLSFVVAVIIGPLLPLASVHADNFWWFELFYDDLEQGTGHWALDDGWTIQEQDNGNHVLAGQGPAVARLLSEAPWEDHRLALRINLLQGEFQLHLREAGGKAYIVRLQADNITLYRRDDRGDLIELASALFPTALHGWQSLMVTLYEDHLMISLNGVEYINYLDLNPLRRGQLLLEAREGCQAEIDDVWITGMLPSPSTPPDPTRISISEAGADGVAEITGVAGSVSSEAVVYLVNLQTLHYVTTTAASDGSFSARLFAPEGSTIQVNYAYPGAWPLFENIGLEGSPAILITVHHARAFGDELPFTVYERLSGGSWIARGELPRRDYRPGEVLTTTLDLRVEASNIAGLNLDRFRINVRVALCRLFDEAGRQLPPIRNLVSAYLTPSGLPVETELEVADPWLCQQFVPGSDMIRQERVLTVTVPLTAEIPAGLPAGVYRPQVKLEFEEQRDGQWLPAESFQWDDDYIMLERQDARRTYPWPWLPPIRIGSPQPPRLAWMLLADYTSNSERGVRAREDTHYCFSPRTVFPTHRFVVPMVHEITGEPLSYLLEPSLPLTSWEFRTLYERVLVSPPSIPFAYPGGELRVQVTKPDGQTDDLGSATFISGLNPLATYRPEEVDPTKNHRSVLVSFNNPGPSDFYRAYTGNERFRYRFTQYGRHVIMLSGQMQDIWGNVYEAGGSYEVWVAHPLDLETGTLLGTPFEIGDTYSPVVRIQPAVPAAVTLDFALYINSSQSNVYRCHIEGKANRFGYFHPGIKEPPIELSAPGEYDILITASYWDAKGELWMGAVRGANVVETPGTSLIAHGERGIRSFAAVKRPLWFFEGRQGNVVPNQTDGLFRERQQGGALHLPYPYYTGDVMWLVDWEGQNSIFPTITFQDTLGSIAALLTARVPELLQGDYYYGQFPVQLLPIDRQAIGELPLVTTTAAGKKPECTYGWPVGQYPHLADQIGYFYSCCVRPDLQVAFQVSESGLGNAYWFADDHYNLQYGVGADGDLTPDFKLNFGGLVFRDLAHGINEYAIYNSCDVYIPVGEQMSNRIMPPFQGAAGGHNGGPLMTLKGRDIDLFVHPTGVKPGTILEVGDTFSFSAQVVPTLGSHVMVTVTTPSGQVWSIAGQANKIGYFYDPSQDFVITEAGLYEVWVNGEHRGLTSVGPVYPPYPQGDILGADDKRFYVFAVERNAGTSLADASFTLNIPENTIVRPAQPLEIRGDIPDRWQNPQVYYTVSLSGFILEQGSLPVVGGFFTYLYDPVALHAVFPNLDISIIPEYLSFIPWNEPEAADTVQMNFFIMAADMGRPVRCARAVTLQGTHLFAPIVSERLSLYSQYLPLILKG